MATRLLLTLLALLTGLAAQLSPAQARISAGSGTEIGQIARGATVQHARTGIVRRAMPAPRQDLRLAAEPCPVATMRGAPVCPPVMLGIDRARE